MRYIYIILIFIFSFTIISCAKKSDTSSTTATTTTEVEGTWITNCFASGSVYRTNTITVTGTDIVAKYEEHTDSNCSTDYALYEDTFDSLSIGDEVTFADDTKGHKFTIEVVSFKLTVQSATSLNIVNTAVYCGYSDWVLNTAKDYTGKTCGSTAHVVANTTVLGMYNLVGNNLFLGTFSTTGSYPTGVSTLITYVKQ
jgi:hypothetical protein